MSTTPSQFADRLRADAAAMVQIVIASIGDRLGMWKDLAAGGAATSTELARRMGLSERHVREWLAAMAAARYLDYDPTTRRFALAPAHAAVLADEGGRWFAGGIHQSLVAYTAPYDRIVETFRTGGGVPQSAYPVAAYEGHERSSAGGLEHALVPEWLTAAGVDDRIAAGIDVCDVGCGGGSVLVKLAQTYPRSRFVGYDVYGPNIQRARDRADRAGVAERVRFVQLDAAAGIPARFDLITAFDVIHDAASPLALLGAVRAALRDGGRFLCLDVRCAAQLEDNCHPAGALAFGISILYGLSTALAAGGSGLGTCGLHADKLRELAREARFTHVESVAIDDPVNQLYVLA